MTLTATVTPTSGTADPDGSVTFTVNGRARLLRRVDDERVSSASMLLTTLPVGSGLRDCLVRGSTDFLASSSAAPRPVTVSKASTTLGLWPRTTPTSPASR